MNKTEQNSSEDKQKTCEALSFEMIGQWFITYDRYPDFCREVGGEVCQKPGHACSNRKRLNISQTNRAKTVDELWSTEEKNRSKAIKLVSSKFLNMTSTLKKRRLHRI